MEIYKSDNCCAIETEYMVYFYCEEDGKLECYVYATIEQSKPLNAWDLKQYRKEWDIAKERYSWMPLIMNLNPGEVSNSLIGKIKKFLKSRE